MFTEERIGEILRQLSLLRYPETVPAIGWKMLRTTGEQRPTPSEACSGWSTIPADGIWGGDCEYYAFAADLTLPETFAGGIRRSSRCSPAARGSGMRRIRSSAYT